MSQAAPDIRKKLQKIEGFEGKLLSELVEIALKSYNHRDTPEDKQGKTMAQAMVTALKEDTKRNGPCKGPQGKQAKLPKTLSSLERNQCAYCKEMGHWKRECPKQNVWAPQSTPGLHLQDAD